MTLLLTLLLKSLLLFAISGLLLFALRRSSAAARSLVCLLTLGALLALPLFSLMLPGWRVPVAEPTPIRPSPALPVREGKESSPLAAAANSSAGAAASPIQLSPTAAPHSKSSLTGRTPAKQGGGFFLLGLLLASVRPLLGLWGIRRLSRTCLDIADPQTLVLTADCARLLGLKTPPRLCVAAVPVPMTWGWRRPVIALPAASTDWPEDRLRSVLLHEMAHIKRRDWPAHRLADFACALYWFHPLVWLTARRLRSETELACDDLVLAAGIPAPDYARHLLEIASALPRVPGRSNAAIAMAQTSKIESRLTMILDKTRPRRPVARRVLVFALLPASAALITLAVLRPDAKAQTAPLSLSADADNPILSLPNGTTVRMVGITDTQRLAPWWSPNGLPVAGILPKNALVYPNLPAGVQGRAFAIAEAYTLAFQPYAVWKAAPRGAEEYQQVQPGVYARRPGETWQFEPDDHKYHLNHFQPERPQGQAQVTQVNVVSHALDAQQQHCRVRYAVAAGPWTQSVKCPKTAGKTTVQTAFGPVIFTLFTNPHRLPAAQAAQGNAVFMVTDRFHYPSRLKSDNPLQATLRDGDNCERVVYALDIEGRIVTQLGGTMHPGTDASGNFKYEQLIPIPNLVLKNIATFQLVARPYQWAEFKDVALQPVK